MSSTFDPNYIRPDWSFEVGAKVVVFNPEGKLLMMRRSQKCTRPGGWDFPGGEMENEQIIDGVQREAQEEAGLKLRDVKLISAQTCPTQTPNKLMLYLGAIGWTDQTDVTLSWEHDAYEWVTPEEALQRELPEWHAKNLQEAITYYQS